MGIRKNITALTTTEREAFFGALLTLKNSIVNPAAPVNERLSIYDIFVAYHQAIFNIALVGILASIVSIYYYLKPVIAMYFQESETPIQTVDAPWGLNLTLVILSTATIALGIFPGQLIALSERAMQGML